MNIEFLQCIRQAFYDSLNDDPRVTIFGLGVGDVKGVFGSTLGLQDKFGVERVFEMPLSENSMTGVVAGMAMNGLIPIINHQRADFTFTSMEQIVNQISKLSFISNGEFNNSIVIRMIVGRGWGQGPTHAQSPQSLFAHVPGLRVVAPGTPKDAYSLLRQSIESKGPTIFIEHRWLHGVQGNLEDLNTQGVSIEESEIVRKGNDLSIISFSYGLIEAMKINSLLREKGIEPEVINLRTISPFDKKTILKSASKTKKVIIIDSSSTLFGISAEISSMIMSELWGELEFPPLRIGNAFTPAPSSPFLAKQFYPEITEIMTKISTHFKFKSHLKFTEKEILEKYPIAGKYGDVPDKGQVGPF